MSKLLTFNRQYFLLTIVIFVVEICIAFFAHDRIVRPYIGDFLVVILLYCFLRSFLKLPVLTTALAVLVFSYAVEISQYFDMVKKLGLANSKPARIILGTSFEWTDLVVYTAGITFVLYVEKIKTRRNHTRASKQFWR